MEPVYLSTAGLAAASFTFPKWVDPKVLRLDEAACAAAGPKGAFPIICETMFARYGFAFVVLSDPAVALATWGQLDRPPAESAFWA